LGIGKEVILDSGFLAAGEMNPDGSLPVSGEIVAPAAPGKYRLRVEAFWAKSVRDKAGDSKTRITTERSSTIEIIVKGTKQ
jgi:hypothetical protein